MTIKRKLTHIFFAVALLTMILAVTASAKVKMYAADGRTVSVADSAVEQYKSVGWYTQPVTKMYAADGRSVVVAYTAVDEYIQVGWYEPVTMYAVDGRTKKVSPFKVEENEQVGWYVKPVIKMYAKDGRTVIIAKSHIAEYKKVGWYEPVTMYALDGRTKLVSPFKVEENEKVGWYKKPVTKMYAADGRTIIIATSEVEAYKKVGWYTEPVKNSSSSSKPATKTPVNMESLTSIGQTPKLVESDKYLTDNYSNKYKKAFFNSFYSRSFEYLLDGKYSKFTGTLYIPHGETSGYSTVFKIEADGKLIYTSPEMTKISRPVNVNVSLAGYNHVKLYFVKSDGTIMVCLANPCFIPA